MSSAICDVNSFLTTFKDFKNTSQLQTLQLKWNTPGYLDIGTGETYLQPALLLKQYKNSDIKFKIHISLRLNIPSMNTIPKQYNNIFKTIKTLLTKEPEQPTIECYIQISFTRMTPKYRKKLYKNLRSLNLGEIYPQKCNLLMKRNL